MALQSRYPFEKVRDIARDINRTEGAIRRMAGVHGVAKFGWAERLHAHYTVNARAFHELTAETAYVLGFILADGSMSGDRLKITNNDLDVMQKILLALGSNHRLMVPTNPRDRTYSLYIRNRELAAGLRRWGICENKSLVGTWPDVPGEALAAVVRGYFDGDGHVSYHHRRGLRLKFTSGSRDLLNGLSAALNRHIGTPLRAIETDHGRPNANRLWYYGKNAATLGDFMYADGGIRIARKREPFLAYATRPFVKG